MCALYNKPSERGASIRRKDMLPGRGGTMVLRGLHPSFGPRVALFEPSRLLSPHFSALPYILRILGIPSCSSIPGVFGVQDACASAGSYHAQREHG